MTESTTVIVCVFPPPVREWAPLLAAFYDTVSVSVMLWLTAVDPEPTVPVTVRL